ncbi:HNH endonuclease [Treponema sp. UBA785]|uniref:HNH endonuclease n=1 Tax=Treponema sp. UBA785 TaxID=1947757 RepID=UPI0026013B61|nr:HNH endonuclease [Treponema sp. UBA785]
MEKSNYPQLDEGLDEKVIGFDGKTFTLRELRVTANEYTAKTPIEERKSIKEKFEQIFNCDKEKIPDELLKEVYGDNIKTEEIWKKVPLYKTEKNGEAEYSVSNFGRIKHYGIIMKQGDKLGKEYGGYLVMKDYTRPAEYNFDSTTCVYRFVAAAFLPNYKKGMHVHHINNNGYDCRPENLILLEKDQHSLVHNFPIPEMAEDPNYGK